MSVPNLYYHSIGDTPVRTFEGSDPEYLTKYDEVTEELFESIKIIAAYDCKRNDHPDNALCSCPRALKKVTIKKKKFLIWISIVLEWEQHILSTDAALRFSNDQDGKNVFFTSHGITAEDFAKAFAVAAFTNPTMTAPASTMDLVVSSLLSYWASKVVTWRNDHGSNAAIRKAQNACAPSNPKFLQVYPHLAFPDPKYPPQLGKNLIFQRMRFGNQHDLRHRHTLFMMPMEPELKPDGKWDTRFMVAGVKPCHESCSLNPHLMTQQLLRHFFHQLIGTFPGHPTAVDIE